MSKHIDIEKTILEIRKKRAIRRRSRYFRSLLSPYSAEIFSLYRSGISTREIRDWLRDTHNVRVDHTTVWKFLKRLPEMGEGSSGNP